MTVNASLCRDWDPKASADKPRAHRFVLRGIVTADIAKSLTRPLGELDQSTLRPFGIKSRSRRLVRILTSRGSS